jgi:hypothetical protein
MLVDRITIKVATKSKELHGFAVAQLYGMADMQKMFVPKGKIIVIPSQYRKRLEYYPEYQSKKSNRRAADIDVGAFVPSGKGKLQMDFRLTLYPSNFRGNEFEQFKETLALLMPEFNYEKLYLTGKVNYLELACDTLSHHKNRFLPYRKGCAKSKVWINAIDGHQGTTYLGSQESSLRFAIYDKHKQMTDKGKTPFTSTMPHTRIEARMRRLGVTAAVLPNIENPFLKLRIADFQSAKAMTVDPDWQDFLVDCLQVGVPEALHVRPEKRKQYREALNSVNVKWWSPAERWSGLLHALNAIAP